VEKKKEREDEKKASLARAVPLIVVVRNEEDTETLVKLIVVVRNEEDTETLAKLIMSSRPRSRKKGSLILLKIGSDEVQSK